MTQKNKNVFIDEIENEMSALKMSNEWRHEYMIECLKYQDATMNKIGRFTKQDIRELCPSLSISEGNGRGTKYYRIN